MMPTFMLSKTCYSFVGLFLLLSCCPSFSLSATAPLLFTEGTNSKQLLDPLSTKHGWKIARPKSETTMIKYFESGGCPHTIFMTYIYDPSQQTWWSNAQIAKQFPQIKDALRGEPCKVPFSAAQIASTFNLEWPQEDGPVLLYFPPLYDEESKENLSIIFPADLLKKYHQQVAVLDQFNALPKYKLVTPFQAELRRPAK